MTGVLAFTPEYPPFGSGIAYVVEGVSRELKGAGTEVAVCSPVGPDVQAGSSRLIGQFGALGPLIFWERSGFLASRSDHRAVWLHNPILLDSPFSMACGVVTMHSTYRGFLKMANRVGLPIPIQRYYSLMARLEERTLRDLGPELRLVGVSPAVCREVAQITGRRVQWIPVGVDTSVFRPANDRNEARRSLDLGENCTLFLSVGRFALEKRPFSLLKTFLFIKEQIPDAKLLWAGDGPLKHAVEVHARRKGDGDVVFMGQVPHSDLAEICRACDIFLMTSSYEGLPLSLLEAMASGLVPVVRDIPALSTVVAQSRSGLVFTRPEEIVSYLGRANLEKESKRSRSWAEGFGWEVSGRKYHELFAEAVT